jgi:Protein of unknown function (DUF3489)
MTTFTINEQNEIVAFATTEEAAASMPAPFESFTSEEELVQLAASWPTERPVAIWNSLAGVTPVKKFKDGKAAAGKIWPRIQRLGESAEPHAEQQIESKAQRKPKGGAQGAKSAPAKGKSSKKATPAKKTPKATKAAKPAKSESGAPREGSKTAQVVGMLQRKNGATISEIMEKMNWQRHTVRGFMAGAIRKAGYTVESFKLEGGERTYRINSK